MKLQGRTVLITGGSSGIGLEFARQLRARGNTVIIAGRGQAALDAAAAAIPGLETVRGDVTDLASIRALHEATISRFPGLDTLVNSAGIMRILYVKEPHELKEVTEEIDINLSGLMRVVQQFVPHLLEQPNALVVNISSGLAFVPFPISPAYSAAKAGVHAYTRCLRIQLADTRVRVVELAPPLTETPLYQAEFSAKMNGQPGMAVDRLVARAISSIEAGKVEVRPGQSNLLKLASRIAPELMLREFSRVK